MQPKSFRKAGNQDVRGVHISQIGPPDKVLHTVELKPLVNDKILKHDI